MSTTSVEETYRNVVSSIGGVGARDVEEDDIKGEKSGGLMLLFWFWMLFAECSFSS